MVLWPLTEQGGRLTPFIFSLVIVPTTMFGFPIPTPAPVLASSTSSAHLVYSSLVTFVLALGWSQKIKQQAQRLPSESKGSRQTKGQLSRRKGCETE